MSMYAHRNVLSLKEKVLDGLTRDIEAPRFKILNLVMSQVSFHNDFQYSYHSSAGRGVIPLEDIPIKTFVCEYTKNIYSKRELEYGLNNESSSCVEV